MQSSPDCRSLLLVDLHLSSQCHPMCNTSNWSKTNHHLPFLFSKRLSIHLSVSVTVLCPPLHHLSVHPSVHLSVHVCPSACYVPLGVTICHAITVWSTASTILTRCRGMISSSLSFWPVIGHIISFLMSRSTHSIVTTLPLNKTHHNTQLSYMYVLNNKQHVCTSTIGITTPSLDISDRRKRLGIDWVTPNIEVSSFRD